MAVIIVNHLPPEVTPNEYGQVSEIIQGQDPPDGMLFHSGFVTGDHIQVVDAWESREQFDAGTDLTVFRLEPGVTRFVSAICFEDVDSTLMARNFAGHNGSKRADFIVNLTNDGWFAGGQMAQHLQLATFRSIENRVPTARSVNTHLMAASVYTVCAPRCLGPV